MKKTHVTHSLSVVSLCTRPQPLVKRLGKIHWLVHLIKVTVINFTPLKWADPYPELDCSVLCRTNILGLCDYRVNNLNMCGSSIIEVIVLQIREQTLSSQVLYFPLISLSVIIYNDIYVASKLQPHRG